MINIISKEVNRKGKAIVYNSVQTLRALLTANERATNSPKLDVCWQWAGVPGALNNTPKVNNFQQLVKFRENDVPTIEFTSDRREAEKWIASGKTVWGRKFNHTQALDVKLPTQPGFWKKSDFWVVVMDGPFDEYRQHIMWGKAISRGLKVLTGTETLGFAARNRRNGWTLQRDTKVPEVVRATAAKAVKALGYDFGAVDIIYKNNIAYVLEVNKAPGLDNKTASAYVKAFTKVAYGEWKK